MKWNLVEGPYHRLALDELDDGFVDLLVRLVVPAAQRAWSRLVIRIPIYTAGPIASTASSSSRPSTNANATSAATGWARQDRAAG